MNKLINSLLAPMLTTVALISHTAFAAGIHDDVAASWEDLSQAEYISEPLECNIAEVATQ